MTSNGRLCLLKTDPHEIQRVTEGRVRAAFQRKTNCGSYVAPVVRVTVNKSQYRALNELRGLPEEAHMLIMCSRPTKTGGILEGSEEAFEELVSFISDEMAEGMLSATECRTLGALCVKVDPDCRDWLGM